MGYLTATVLLEGLCSVSPVSMLIGGGVSAPEHLGDSAPLRDGETGRRRHSKEALLPGSWKPWPSMAVALKEETLPNLLKSRVLFAVIFP